MSSALQLPDGTMTRAEYRAWADAQPRGRFERIDGVVVAMAPERLLHIKRKMKVSKAMERAVQAAGLPCEVYGDGATIETGENDFEPDAVLRCGPTLPPDAIAIPDPIVIVEVLSPSTRNTDLTRKLIGYFSVPTLHHYLVVFVERLQIIHHRRSDAGDSTIVTTFCTTGAIRLDPPGVTISVEEIYAD